MSCNITVQDLGKVYPLARSGASFDLMRSDSSTEAILNPTVADTVKEALAGVSFTIHDGERVGFIGENGAGKSTLLQILAGVTQPSSGKLNILGQVHAVLTLGMGLREELSGRENLYLDGEIQGKTRAEIDGMIDEMIEFIDIGEFIDKPVRTYSSGMKARLTFASLIFVDPEILLIDEALGAGDYKFNAKASKVIKDLCNRGKIVIVVSHGLEVIVDLCTRCIWLDHGKIVQDGDPAEVTEAYRAWVRKRDEKIAYEKFSNEISCQSQDDTCEISLLEIGMASSARNIVFTGEDVWIRIKWRLNRKINNPDFRISFERMDGLLVAQQNLTEADVAVDELHYSGDKKLLMSPFLPRDGTYKLTVEFLEEMNVVSVRSIIFKVIDDRKFKGGSPVLRASMTVNVQSLSQDAAS